MKTLVLFALATFSTLSWGGILRAHYSCDVHDLLTRETIKNIEVATQNDQIESTQSFGHGAVVHLTKSKINVLIDITESLKGEGTEELIINIVNEKYPHVFVWTVAKSSDEKLKKLHSSTTYAFRTKEMMASLSGHINTCETEAEDVSVVVRCNKKAF